MISSGPTRSAPLRSAPLRSAPTQSGSGGIPREVWRVAFVIVFGAFMAGLDTSLVNVGLQTMTRSLHGSLAEAQWVGSSYLVALAAALPLCGWLGKRIGPARVWMFALAGFTAASVACAAAASLRMLIVCRVLQGIAGGLLVPSGQTVLGQAAGPRHMGTVMNTAGVAVVLAPAIGPAIGGLLSALSWRWLFLVNLPIGLLALLFGYRLLPREQPRSSGRLDIVGLLLLSLSLPTFTYGIVQATGGHVDAWLGLSLSAAGLLLYVVHAVHHAQPILNLGLFRKRAYALAQTAIFFCGISLYGGLILLPLYFRLLRHASVTHTGFLLLAYGAGSAISLRLAGQLTDHMGGGGLIASVGLLLTILSTLPFASLPADTSLALVEILQFLRGVGASFAGLPVMSSVYALVKHDELPDATVQANILQRVGGSLGSALIVVLLDRYRPADTAAFQRVFLWLTLSAIFALAATVWLASEQRKDMGSA